MTPHVRALPFSAAMARAWVEGRKTQTRRVIVPQPKNAPTPCHYTRTGWAESDGEGGCKCNMSQVACPYGAPGDTLVLTGEWAVAEVLDAMPGRELPDRTKHWTIYDSPEKPGWCGRTRLARFVPKRLYRWFPHTTLEDVRAQRVQEITLVDAIAEGFPDTCHDDGTCTAEFDACNPIRLFLRTWDFINAKRNGGIYAWDKSPWVFALTIGGPK